MSTALTMWLSTPLFAYILAYNYLPPNLRLAFGGLFASAVVLLSAFHILLYGRRLQLIAGAVIGAIALCLLVPVAAGSAEFNGPEALRYLAPLCLAVLTSGRQFRLRDRILLIGYLGVLLSGILHAAAGSISYAGLARFSPFSGGEDGIHTSAYLVAIVVIALDHARQRATMSPRTTLGLMSIGGVLLAGYAVATPVFGLLSYFGAIALTRSDANMRRPRRSRASLWVLLSLLVLGAAVLAQRAGDDLDVDVLTSGRTTTWIERLDLLSHRSIDQTLFGTGLGSDAFVSEVWWWEEKDSHNDLIRSLVELGLTGTVLLIGLVVIVSIRFGRSAWPALVFFVTTSLSSNGLVFRPFVAMLLWLVIADASTSRQRCAAEGSQGSLPLEREAA